MLHGYMNCRRGRNCRRRQFNAIFRGINCRQLAYIGAVDNLCRKCRQCHGSQPARIYASRKKPHIDNSILQNHFHITSGKLSQNLEFLDIPLILKGEDMKIDRKCTLCNMNEIEDEYHFILQCPIYETIRKQYIKKYYYRNYFSCLVGIERVEKFSDFG